MIRIKNAKILTLKNGFDIAEGEIHIKGDKIAYIGTPKDGEFEREIDARGNLLMPSFKNAHTHTAMTFLRSFADDLPLHDWLNKQVFPMEAKLSADDIRIFARLGILEYLTSGITACFDMYFFRDAFAEVMASCGFRGIMCAAINDYGGTVEEVEEEYLRFRGCSPFVSYRFGIHGEYTTRLETIKGIVSLCQKYHEGFWAHNSETLSEVDGCKERYGMTPTELFDSLGAFEYGGGGFHCVHFEDKDFEIFKKRGLWAVTNAGSNTKLASGIADISRFIADDIPLAVGTDGAASNNALDMFREMFLITGLQKLRYGDAAACPAEKVLRAATVGSARAMGLSDCDILDVGKQADIVMIDLNQPNMTPQNNIVKNIVYSGSKQNVKMTMCAGKVLYLDGEFFLDVPVGDIYAEAQGRAEALKK